MTYKAAIIGVGAATNSQGRKGGGHQIGYTHADMYRRNPNCHLVAGVDINPANLAAFQDRFAVPHGFADVSDMLRETRPDIVSIATYVGLHRKFIEQCARAGVRGILCEKPFLTSPADIAPVRALAAETGVKIAVAHIRRYRPAFVRARDLVRVGAIGTPQLFFSSLPGWDLSEMGSHWFDLFRFFNQDDEVRWVLGQTRVRDTKGYGHAIEDNAVAHFAFANGLRGLIEAGEAINSDANFGFVLVGSAGVIRIRAEQVLSLETLTGSKVEDFQGAPPPQWTSLGIKGDSNEWMNLWDCTLADLLRWIQGEPSPRVGLESALRTLEVNHAAYLSALTGDRVELPLQGKLLEINRWPVDLLAERPR